MWGVGCGVWGAGCWDAGCGSMITIRPGCTCSSDTLAAHLWPSYPACFSPFLWLPHPACCIHILAAATPCLLHPCPSYRTLATVPYMRVERTYFKRSVAVMLLSYSPLPVHKPLLYASLT